MLTRYRINARYFYPRSPCGERPNLQRNQHQRKQISIHALLAESDYLGAWKSRNVCRISIHALLAESDVESRSNILITSQYFYPRSPCGERPPLASRTKTVSTDFYPRSPCGERRKPRDLKSRRIVFLSTLSLRRATAKVHKTVGHFCAYETNFMGIASSC